MFFPYSTDAPIYYWPITTVVMIAVNVLVFCALLADPEQAKPLVLWHGNGLHPVQWVTSNFVHAGIMHLVGNMLALIQSFHKQQLWADSVPVMVEYLSQHSEKAAPVRLKLAQILAIEQHRPAQALKVLAKVDESTLDERQREFLRKLRAKAAQLHRDESAYEVADQDW